MFSGYRIGTLFGFPIRVHLSFLALLGVVFFFMGGTAGLFVTLMVAGSVVVHELGHALVARRRGVPVAEIGLHFFGGAAQLTALPARPADEIAIAAAGPAVSFALAGLGHALAWLTGISVFALFGWVNLVLGTFNLLPAFPSDGGRILRAALAPRFGFVRATELAVTVGRVACGALIVAGLYSSSMQLVVVALALWSFGSRERLAARLRGDHGAWRGSQAPRTQVDYIPPGGPRHPEQLFADRRPPVFIWRR